MTAAASTIPVAEIIDPRDKARQAARYAGVAAFLILLGSFIVGVIVPTSLVVPDPDPGLGELAHILRSNLTILIALGFCAGLQHFSRQEVEDGSKPWIRWICDAVVTVFIVLNVTAIGFAVGQLGGAGLVRILPHAWLEVPAFALGVWGYLRARFNTLTPHEGFQLFGLAVVLLLIAAPIEVFISGGIR